LKWFRDRRLRIAVTSACALITVGVSLGAVRPLRHVSLLLLAPGHAFDRWTENLSSGSDVEKAVYRLMELPAGSILFRRTPHEAVPALSELQQSQKTSALYSLRALEEEHALDFAAAERDWKAWADGAADRIGAHLDLAEFYERRLQPQLELGALEYVGNAPPDPYERWTAVEAQRSWQAFERAVKVADKYALSRSESARIYAAWIRRHPKEPSLYARQFAFFLGGKDFPAATALIAQYRAAFPEDQVFPVKAEADLAVRRGQPKDGLAVYGARFEPLWPAELVKNYFALVLSSHDQRAFSDAARARIAANPDNLKDAARLFYFYQQQGQLDSAKAVLTKFRESRESRGAKWTADELETIEKLFEGLQDFPEAARYAYALAADRSTPSSERSGVIALTRILLTAPEQPLRVGAGNLALYRDIATMDRGLGYLNGILSLFLNTQGLGSEYDSEDQLAVSYFHRARAAELLTQIDQRFPDDPARPQLHASLMEADGVYGDTASVIREGTAILAQFPHFAGRVHVALQLASAYDRTHQVDKELAIYQDLLKELAAQADGVPLGAPGNAYSKPVEDETPPPARAASAPESTDAEPETDAQAPEADSAPAKAQPGARSRDYARVLDRDLARLVSLHRLPDALMVLRAELDRNPQDPGLYERLADFLQQNALNSHEEEVFQRAIDQFQDTSWYSKLARFYLRQRRNADYSALMHKVANIFSGTELEEFLEQAPAPDESLALEVNAYANQRFPHDLRFVERLIPEYTREHNDAAVEKLLWEHWSESSDLRDRLFELLSRTHRLDSTLATLHRQSPEIDKSDWSGLSARNPAAERFWLEACLWQSHFEQGVDAAGALAAVYPADTVLGEEASSLYRSLAYFHPDDTDKSVAIQKHLLEASPGNLDALARIGDIYADRERFAEAAPYWIRMADVYPGEPDGYLQSATVFWDYFDFASAQAQLDKARARLSQPALFSYQEGSIAESRGDLSEAVRAYTAGAIAEDASAESRDRLLALARRAAIRAQVEKGTAHLLKQATPSAQAIQLRAGILEAEHRKDDLARELNELIAQTGSFDVLDAISAAARSHALPDVEQSALRRQIALTTDPVRNIQLHYQLVDLLQQRSAPAAAEEIDAIYRDHSKILGVVRPTVDYDWNHDRKQKAVSVLFEAAQASYSELKSQFQLEAARKLTDLGEYARSRSLLTALSEEKPLDPAYESVMADNLARSKDSPGLEAFYRTQLDLVRKASINRDEKQQRIGQLRRGIIAAASQLGQFDEAVDQFIELINAFPDDAALAQEAALFAVAHKDFDRLLAFYQKTIGDSPRDPRWSIVLARLATAAEEDALAIDAYGRALRLRPERQDLYFAQASLEERLHRLDDAIALYRKLYTLSYRDPKWMEKVAELCARQGLNSEAVKALETGWIEGRPAKASNFFAVADRLEKWNLLDEAQGFAERGIEVAGADLLVSEQSGAANYARILARKRQAPAAFAYLVSARIDAPKLGIATVARQVVEQGASAVTDEEWRKQRKEQRQAQATVGFASALHSLSAAASEFYTPEEKSEFAALLRQHVTGASREELTAVYLPAAKAAGLSDLTAELQWTVVLDGERQGNIDLSEWLQFQKQRVQMDSAAALLEKAAPALLQNRREQMLRDAASAYRDGGDTVGELRVTEKVYESQQLDNEALNRFYRLLLAQRPDELIRIASSQDSAAYYLVRNGTPAQALAGVAARAAGRPPVWRDATTALAGLYVREYTPGITSAFSTLDAESTIGDRIDHPLDRNQHLAGDVWFYYGSRFAEYLDGTSDPRAEDFLPSELERTPGNPDAYLRLADYSATTKRAPAALADYQHSLDLRPDQPAVLDSIALLQWNAGNHSEALAAWSIAVKRLAEEMDARHVPETFWSDFGRVLESIKAHDQFESVRQAVDAMLRIYVARNGNYRVEPLLEDGYRANGNPVDWLLNITAAASNQASVLYSILPNSWSDQGAWIETDKLDRIYQRILEVEERNSQGNPPGSYDPANSARLHLVEALIAEKRTTEAWALLEDVSLAQRNSPEWLPSVLQIAEADGTLDSLIGSWAKQPGTAPADDALRRSSADLMPPGRRAVLRFVYQRALDRRELTAPNFLGLASIDLEENNTAAAIELLKRLTMVSSDMYADMDAAAHLLEDRHLPAEALQFLHPLSEASPWNASYKVRVAQAMVAANAGQSEALGLLSAVAADARAPYVVRVSAALALKGHAHSASGSEELQLLAQPGCPTPEAVSKPYFVASRLQAGECAANLKSKEHLLREGIATAPDDPRVRLRYIFAAFGANFDSRALIAADPYLQGYYYPGAAGSLDNTEEPAESEESASQPNQARTLAALPPKQAAHLLLLASAAYQRRRDYLNASRIVSMGLALVHELADRKPLEDRQKQILQDQARSQQNDARAPTIRPEMDQPNVVRPRLRTDDPVTSPVKSTSSEDQP
jgi:predicted Zn-dependent protease